MSSSWRESVRHAFAWRLGLWYAALFVGSTATLALVTYVLLARALAAQDHDVLQQMLTRYANEYARAGLGGLRRLLEADASEGRHERLMVRVVNDRAEVVYFATPPGWTAFNLSGLDATRRSPSRWQAIADPTGGAVLELGSVGLPYGVTVQVGRSSHVRDELLRRFRERALQVGSLIVLVAAIGGLLLTSAGLRPIRELDATIRRILRTGRLDARVATLGTDDPLDQIGTLVNEMLGRIQTLVGGMRGALDNVAHDLRTPLTRFRNVAEAAIVTDDPAEWKEGLARALEEADRVNATLTALMDISQAETGTMQLTYEAVDVRRVTEQAVSLFADEAEDRGLVLTMDVPEGMHVEADATRLRQVLANLIENAVKYTEPGGRIALSASAGSGEVTWTVRDTGIGIAVEHLPFIWDRLYRADASRSARGLGLGLSLVKAIIEAHGGGVAVVSTPGAGSTFSVRLPQARPTVRETDRRPPPA
jgi:signal transduction histidine kinase